MNFEWQELTPQVQLVTVDDTVAGILFEQQWAHDARRTGWEMWWIPAAQTSAREVLFGGVAEDPGAGRWQRARQAAEIELAPSTAQ